jgi:hypothetical protein
MRGAPVSWSRHSMQNASRGSGGRPVYVRRGAWKVRGRSSPILPAPGASTVPRASVYCGGVSTSSFADGNAQAGPLAARVILFENGFRLGWKGQRGAP